MTRFSLRGLFGNMSAMSDDLPRLTGEGTGGRSWREMFHDLAGGQARALEEIYEAAAGRIFGLALWRTGSRDGAYDVLQEVLVRLVEQGDRLRKVRNQKAWVLAVAHRVAVKTARRRRKWEPLESCRFLESTPGDADRELDAGKASSLLAALPPAQREAVYLRHFAEFTFAEIGRVLRPGGLSVVAMSHRCFPTKAIRAFHVLGGPERLALVARYHELAGGFEAADTHDVAVATGADPLWVVTARRSA